MSVLSRIFGERRDRDRLRPLYSAIVAAARDPRWYREGQVPDTLDGRFDMIAAVLTLVLLRLEQENERTRDDSVALTETFIGDMEASLRQLGIGDLVVGKHVGRMVSALGGRLSAFRDVGSGPLDVPVARNVFHESPPSPEVVAFVARRLEQLRDSLSTLPTDRILAGEVPAP